MAAAKRISVPVYKIQRGFSLLEVLITVLVLSIGLLGLAGLQATSLRNNHSAYLRSQATIMSYDIADRMRANRITALAGNYDVSFGSTATGSTVAATDVAEWKTKLQNELPSGDGKISRNGSVFTITVRWDDSRGSEAPASFAMETRL